MNVAVIGGYRCTKKVYRTAEECGRLIAREGWVLICGGGAGVMEGACKGAKEAGGMTVGILPGSSPEEGNRYLSVAIPTGVGCARNVFVVRSAHALIAVDGRYGTLSEIAFALNEQKPVYGVDTWKIKGVRRVPSPREAVARIKKLTRAQNLR
ncbi:MAG: TIGR00725 family protein [Candidatus Omnitrophica bacterium]|nr:TIGR00725 family protein [Candidatus Omnitrophota bacterium]